MTNYLKRLIYSIKLKPYERFIHDYMDDHGRLCELISDIRKQNNVLAERIKKLEKK
jgi:hypothetical protein